jgi:hypothetical protein
MQFHLSRMDTKLQSGAGTETRRRGLRFGYVLTCLVLMVCAPGLRMAGQNAISAPPRPTSILLPEANHLPDANDRMLLNEKQEKRQNFDAVNALREQQISDETVKLLILAKDLRAQMEKIGDKPLPERLVREAEVIELLAHDVQKKMTLTVKGS